MFLNINDYKPIIQDAVLQAVVGSSSIEGNPILLAIETSAQIEMESYLSGRYDVINIFNKTGEDRNELIVMYMIDIALYHLHSRINPNKVPEIRTIRYESAINWLKAVSRGELSPDLPLLKNENGENIGSVLFGSEIKRNNYF